MWPGSLSAKSRTRKPKTLRAMFPHLMLLAASGECALLIPPWVQRPIPRRDYDRETECGDITAIAAGYWKSAACDYAWRNRIRRRAAAPLRAEAAACSCGCATGFWSWRRRGSALGRRVPIYGLAGSLNGGRCSLPMQLVSRFFVVPVWNNSRRIERVQSLSGV